MAAPRDAGLTLVEMLVVLAIIGVMTSAAVLAIGGADRSAEAEARVLAARLRLAADETLVTNRRLAFAWDKRGYAFLGWDPAEGRWQAGADKGLGARHDLPAGLSLAGEGAEVTPILVDGGGAPISLAVSGRSGDWRVAFDGLDATATAGAQR